MKWAPDSGKNYVRIHKGNPESPNSTQRVDYVKIIQNKDYLDVNGKPIRVPYGQKPKETPESHIPYDKWIQWKDWCTP